MREVANVPETLAASLASWPRPLRGVLAISGGADSMALFHAWNSIRHERGDELTIATFDHGLRSDSADDADFVRQQAVAAGLSFEVGRPEPPLSQRNGSPEEAARQARYAFLLEIAKRHEATVIATAHHADDQVETVLHRLTRGTGLMGLAGMAPRRRLADGIELIRPLLRAKKDDLSRYLEQNSWSYREDATNNDFVPTRNRVRHLLLPMLREHFNPRVDDAILRLAELAASSTVREQKLIEELRQELVRHIDEDVVELDREKLAGTERHLAGCFLRNLFSELHWPLKGIGRQSIESALGVAHPAGPTAVHLPGSIEVRRVGEVLRFARERVSSVVASRG